MASSPPWLRAPGLRAPCGARCPCRWPTRRARAAAAPQSEEGFFQEKQEKAPLPAEYVANQKAVDAALLGKLRCAAPPGAPPCLPLASGASCARLLCAARRRLLLGACRNRRGRRARSTAACPGRCASSRRGMHHLLRWPSLQTPPHALGRRPCLSPPAATTSRATSPPASRCALATGRTS